MGAFKDITGRQFGRLLVIGVAKKRKNNHIQWRCRCSCGKLKTVLGYSLRSGNTRSCGCLAKEKFLSLVTKHGHGDRSTEYSIWKSMKTRCGNPNVKSYARYGGRGISVCDRWQKDFANFYADMGPRPSTNHSIDRINNDGNYEPSNCRWATRKQQRKNQTPDKPRTSPRKNNKTGISGVRKQGAYWEARITVNKVRMHLISTRDLFEACCRRKSAEIKYLGNPPVVLSDSKGFR